MNITAKITGIKYKIKSASKLEEVNINDFDINSMPSYCLLKDNNKTFAISKWVSPKRTRSYPYERIYNTLTIPKKITVIPIIKDEGSEGDRDFIQWDTVSLMSLLDVYVIFAYYNNASVHRTRKDKITNQKIDNKFIISKIKEISNYHSSALHWNLKEVKSEFSNIIGLIKKSYSEIAKKHNIKLHSEKGIDDFQNQFKDDVKIFMDASRDKAQKAQQREVITIQPKEKLTTLTKATITIENYLGGKYYFTTDEIIIKDNVVSLIESKHSRLSLLPSKGDIKDGLLKMILYSNLKYVIIDKKKYKALPVLNLTSVKLKGSIENADSEILINKFFTNNKLNSSQRLLLKNLFSEAKTNKFRVVIRNG